MASLSRQKISFEIDTQKVSAAKEILGTKTLTDTIDAALLALTGQRPQWIVPCGSVS